MNISNLIVCPSRSVNQAIAANDGVGVNFTWDIPSGYSAVAFAGYSTSGPGGAINIYSCAEITNSLYGKKGTVSTTVWFRNYTNSTQLATLVVLMLCARTS